MRGDRRLPVGALLLVVLLTADVRGLVDLGALARTGGAVAVGVVVGVARGSANVMASALQPQPPVRPRRKRPKATSNPPAAAAPSGAARAGIPPTYLRLYREAGATYGVDWRDLAGIGQVESDHGRSSAPGVRSGVNAFGCCAGPMQFHLRNGPPSTWDTYGNGGNPYDPRDAIPAAARLLKANGYGDKHARPGYRHCPGIQAAPGTINALRHYNNACWYVARVLASY